MRIPEYVSFFLLLLVVTACENASEPSIADTDAEAHFAGYARALYAELRAEPLDSTLQTEIGWFGDLSVDAGERAVMRQYRYRIDSSEYGPVAHMAFQVRDTDAQNAPIPVVLTFAAPGDEWHLERAVFGDAVNEPAPDSTEHVEHQPSQEPAAERAQTPLHRSLRVHFDAWLDAAIARTRTPPAD